MAFNIKVRYYIDSEESLVFYTNPDCTVVANVFVLAALFMFFLVGFFVDNLFFLLVLSILLPAWSIAFVLYHLGERKVIIDKSEKAIYTSTAFSKKYVASLLDVSFIRYEYDLEKHAGSYVCYFKSDPYGEGLPFTPGFMLSDKNKPKVKDLHTVGISLLRDMLPDDLPDEIEPLIK